MAVKPAISALIYGTSGTGKSWSGATSPAPRLLIDAEGGGRFAPRNHPMVPWNPLEGPPPEWDGKWQACFVPAHNWKTLDAALQWLESGNHPFRSVVVDSLTEAQKSLIGAVSGIAQPQLQQWGEVLRRLEDYVRRLRDLTTRQDNPLEAVIVICLADTTPEGKTIPMVRGQLKNSLGAFFDVVVYQFVDSGDDGLRYQGLIAPINGITAKDRTNMILTKYPNAVVPETDVSEWIELIRPMFS